jgi:hypothetical protein
MSVRCTCARIDCTRTDIMLSAVETERKEIYVKVSILLEIDGRARRVGCGLEDEAPRALRARE